MRPIHIERYGVVEQLAAELERRILDGDLPPGAPLTESALGPDLGLSRSTVREAIRGLVPGGLVRHRRHRGFVVAGLDAADVRDLYRARAVLELAAARAPMRELRARLPVLEESVRDLASAQRAADWSALFRAHRSFHSSLVGALRSSRLERTFRDLFGELRLAMAQVERRREGPEATEQDHRILTKCIRQGDRRGLLREVRAHLVVGEQRVLKRLERSTGAEPRSATAGPRRRPASGS